MAVGMPMEKAVVYENHSFMLFEDDVGVAWQIRLVKSKAVAELMQHAPNGFLGFGVFLFGMGEY